MDLLFRDRLEAIRVVVDATAWRGRSGTSDLLVLRELLVIAGVRCSLVISLNLRSIAERCGLSLNAVWKAIRRLKARGLVKVAHGSRLPGQSTTYRLCSLQKCAFANKELQPPTFPYRAKYCSQTHTFDLDVGVAHDLWRGRRGLGKGQQRIYSLLGQPGRWTVAGLVRETGYHSSTVRHALQVLAFYDLAQRNGHVWRRGSAEPDAVAKLLGLDSAGDRQRRQHQRERETFRKWLAARDRIHVDRETGEVLNRRIPDLVAEAWRRLGDRTRAPIPIIAEVRT